jgi:hypothetical protein
MSMQEIDPESLKLVREFIAKTREVDSTKKDLNNLRRIYDEQASYLKQLNELMLKQFTVGKNVPVRHLLVDRKFIEIKEGSVTFLKMEVPGK